MENIREIIDTYNESLGGTGIVYYYRITYLNFYKEYKCDSLEENISNFLFVPFQNTNNPINFTLPSCIRGDLGNLKEFQIFDSQKHRFYWDSPIIRVYSCSSGSLGSPSTLSIQSDTLSNPLILNNNGKDFYLTLSERDIKKFPWDTPLDLRVVHAKDWEKIKSTINIINVNRELSYFSYQGNARQGFPMGSDGKLKLDYAIKVEVVMGKDFMQEDSIAQYNDIELYKTIYDISNDFDKVTEKLQSLRTMIELTVG